MTRSGAPSRSASQPVLTSQRLTGARLAASFIRHLDLQLALEPFRHRQSFGTQELRIEQFGLIARAVVGENGNDGVAGAKLAREPDRAGDIDAGRAAHA